jgi:hypothetical protein
MFIFVINFSFTLQDNLSCIIIKLENAPLFNPIRYHADIELEAKISSTIEKYVDKYKRGRDVFLEDILISLLEDRNLDPSPGSGVFLKFKFVKNLLKSLEPGMIDSESDDISE